MLSNCPTVAPSCTGTFFEAANAAGNGNDRDRPLAGTTCDGPCIVHAGRWGSTYCWTEPVGSPNRQWGAECVHCGVDNAGLNCWDPCSQSQGSCGWCGAGGICCRKGWGDTCCGCDGSIGGDGHHWCVAAPDTETASETFTLPTATETETWTLPTATETFSLPTATQTETFTLPTVTETFSLPTMTGTATGPGTETFTLPTETSTRSNPAVYSRCTWTTWVVGSIAGNNVGYASPRFGNALTDCKIACDGSNSCKSVDYQKANGECIFGGCQIGDGTCVNDNDGGYLYASCIVTSSPTAAPTASPATAAPSHAPTITPSRSPALPPTATRITLAPAAGRPP
eukprot:gene58355-biopygen68131